MFLTMSISIIRINFAVFDAGIGISFPFRNASRLSGHTQQCIKGQNTPFKHWLWAQDCIFLSVFFSRPHLFLSSAQNTDAAGTHRGYAAVPLQSFYRSAAVSFAIALQKRSRLPCNLKFFICRHYPDRNLTLWRCQQDFLAARLICLWIDLNPQRA